MVLTLGNKSKPDARYTQSLCLNTNFTGKILQGPFVLKALFPHDPPHHISFGGSTTNGGKWMQSNQLSTAFQEKQSLASRRGPK